ncbi:MAG: RNA polymerase sigma-70 factor [Odoribacter sp.]|nr:RNA polymerase sigma-70 factor [Odoribacter sp.]
MGIKGENWFDSNFKRYYQRLCYFALQYVKDADVAEDIVQGIFIRLLDNKEHIKSEEHLQYYLYQSVRNACINETKSRILHSNLLEKLQKQEAEKEEENFFWQIVRTEVYQKIEKAVSELPPECGKIFRMAYFEHLENPEIAARLSISINTVKVQKTRAKHALREKLKDIYPLVTMLLGI